MSMARTTPRRFGRTTKAAFAATVALGAGLGLAATPAHAASGGLITYTGLELTASASASASTASAGATTIAISDGSVRFSTTVNEGILRIAQGR
ncbi:MAG: hypothetical protein ACRD2W_23180 [Acidimicrobiales bacterium]